MMVSLPPDYRPSEDEEFMNPVQVEYFRQKLMRWRADLLRKPTAPWPVYRKAAFLRLTSLTAPASKLIVPWNCGHGTAPVS